MSEMLCGKFSKDYHSCTSTESYIEVRIHQRKYALNQYPLSDFLDLHCRNIGVEFPFLRTFGVEDLTDVLEAPICRPSIMVAPGPHPASIPHYAVETPRFTENVFQNILNGASSITVKLVDFGCAFRPGTEDTVLPKMGVAHCLTRIDLFMAQCRPRSPQHGLPEAICGRWDARSTSYTPVTPMQPPYLGQEVHICFLTPSDILGQCLPLIAVSSTYGLQYLDWIAPTRGRMSKPTGLSSSIRCCAKECPVLSLLGAG